MATNTTNYNLKKPAPEDYYNIQDANDNMDKIDIELKNVNDKADGAIQKNLGTAADQVMVSSGVGAWIVKSLAQFKAWLGLGSAAYTESSAYATAAQGTTADDTADALNVHKAENAIQTPKTGSTANAILVDFTLTQGNRGAFKATASNTGNMTINGLPFLKYDGSQIPAGAVKANKTYDFYYDSTNGGRFFLIAKASGNAVAGDVLASKTFSNDDGEQTGTMIDRAGDTAALASAVNGNTLKLKASAGYRDGANDYVTITDAEWIEANIKNGVNIFGKIGTCIPMPTVTAGDLIWLSADNLVSMPGGVSGVDRTVKLLAKQIQVNTNGTIRLKCDLSNGAYNSDPSGDGYGQFYKNNSPIGSKFTAHNRGSSYLTCILDTNINYGDTLQFYIWAYYATGAVTGCKNFRACCSSIPGGSVVQD